MKKKMKVLIIWIMASLVSACFFEEPKPKMSTVEFSLYSGVPGIAELGDDKSEVRLQKGVVVNELNTQASFDQIGVDKVLVLATQGISIYLRNNKVAMVELIQPFRGKVLGKNFSVFGDAVKPEQLNWTEKLTSDLGPYSLRMKGAMLGTEALFYTWGDIVYNNMGPYQIAIYREPSIGKYRRENFGKDVQLIKPAR